MIFNILERAILQLLKYNSSINTKKNMTVRQMTVICPSLGKIDGRNRGNDGIQHRRSLLRRPHSSAEFQGSHSSDVRRQLDVETEDLGLGLLPVVARLDRGQVLSAKVRVVLPKGVQVVDRLEKERVRGHGLFANDDRARVQGRERRGGSE